MPNGVTVSYGYDNANQLTSITHANVSGTLGDLSYIMTSVGGTYARSGLPDAVASGVYDANTR